MPHNPKWSRDELILALDLYMRRRNKLPGENDPEIAELSALLRAIASPAMLKLEAFRSLDGVAMKLGNFQSLDPHYKAAGRKGLPNGSHGDKAVWKDFADRPDALHEAALAIRAIAATGPVPEPSEIDDGEEAEASEGGLLTRLHKSRERNRGLIKKKKDRVFKTTGKLQCEGCGFEFKEYGTRGADFIEVHHTKPVHELRPGDKTKLEDLSVLCANCHRIVHRKRPWLTLAQLKEIAPERRSG